jgi:PAS domain S-box-containing protein
VPQRGLDGVTDSTRERKDATARYSPNGWRAGVTDSTGEHEHAASHYSREELEQLLGISLDAFCMAGLDGTLLLVNRALERISGLARRELIGRKLVSLVHPDDAHGVREAFAALSDNGEPVGFSGRFHSENGWRWLDWRAVCVGELVHAAARDVTETRLAERALLERQRTQEQLRTLAVDLAALPSDASIQDFLTRRLLEFSGAATVLFSDYDSTDRVLVTTHAELDSRLLTKATRLLGRGPIGFRSPVSEETYRFMLGNVVAIKKTFTEVSFGAVPRPAGAALKKLLGADHFIGLGYVVEGELYGTSVLAIKPGVPDPPFELLESFTHIAAVSLRRRRAEDELAAASRYNRGLIDTTLDVMVALDLQGRITDANKAAEALSGYSRAELVGTDMTLWVTEPDVARASLAQVLRTGAQRDIQLGIVGRDGRTTPVLFNSAVIKDASGAVTGVLAAARDMTELKQAEDDVRRTTEQLRQALQGTVLAMSHIVELRDPYTSGHERRVADLATAIGGRLGLDADRLDGLRLSGLIHDVGKLAVPAEILAKPGRLTDIEFKLIMQHPQAGYDILAGIEFNWPVAEMVLQHHERCDGSGYPRALRADDILLEAKILAVADVVEAMSSHRPYRAALGKEAALAEIGEHAGVRYDADVAAACATVMAEGFELTP